jgi:hypothetical protein
VTAGDVELFERSLCGTKWLRHYEGRLAFEESGRWHLAPVTDAELHATKDVLEFLRSRPWHFYEGASPFPAPDSQLSSAGFAAAFAVTQGECRT